MQWEELVREQRERKCGDEGRGRVCILWELVTLCPGSAQKQLDQTSMNEGASAEGWRVSVAGKQSAYKSQYSSEKSNRKPSGWGGGGILGD